jgi:UMF1 family MFS transporter
VLVLLICAAFLFGVGSTSIYMMQLCVAFVGVWWISLTVVPALFWLHARPGPPLPKNENYFIFGWKKTFRTLSQCRKLKNLFMFLLSWFFYADGFSTIATVAILFAKSALNMTSLDIMIIAIVTYVCLFNTPLISVHSLAQSGII